VSGVSANLDLKIILKWGEENGGKSEEALHPYTPLQETVEGIEICRGPITSYFKSMKMASIITPASAARTRE
jgi:hypothetical protein